MTSPAQLEKACKSVGYDYKKFEDLVVMYSSGTTMAPMSDKREAVPSAGALKAALETASG